MTPTLGNTESLLYFAPELCLTAGAVLLFLLDLLVREAPRRVGLLVSATLGVLGCAAVATWLASGHAYVSGGASLLPMANPVALFGGLLVLDPWAVFFKYFAVGVTAAAVVIAGPSLEIAAERMGEYCALLLSIAVGLMLMASAADFLMMVVGIELVSMVSYALAGFRKHQRRSSEAALKYVVYGGVASGVMLFGMSWLYGLLGTTSLLGLGDELQKLGASGAAESGSAAHWVLLVAVAMVLAGVGYKIAAVPWHMWCPDVYEGAPTPFTAFLSVGPKAAGFALAIRFLYGGLSASGAFGASGPSGDVALAVNELPWPALVGVLSALSMTVGNLAALSQTNIKRMLAYSSIAHAGYLLMGVAAASSSGSQSVLIYLLVYLLMNLGAFVVVGTVARQSGEETLADYRGLSSRAPFVAIALAIFLFSLTGLPPLAGFVGKFHLFQALIARGGTWQNGLAVIGLVNSAISLYYYARVVRAMFLEKATGEWAERPLELPASYSFLLGFFVLAVIVLGVYFEGLRRLASGFGLLAM